MESEYIPDRATAKTPKDWEWVGFNDATDWLLDPTYTAGLSWEKKRELFDKYYQPPESTVENCAGCTTDYGTYNPDCSRCMYNLGWDDGAAK